MSMDLICPQYLEGLVDAIRLCSLQVFHPLVLRKGQRPPACGQGCNASLNLVKLANELVTSVASNPKYLNIVPWACSVCLNHNIGSTRCSQCPYDPIQNNPFYNLLAKHFTLFFKRLVALVSSNPPINYIPTKVTNFLLIKSVLSSHGQNWQALLPINTKLIRNCNCLPPPTSPPPQSTETDIPDEEDDDMLLLLNCSSESLYEVETS